VARPSAAERQRGRSLADLRAALDRRDADRAIASLFKLAPAERAALLPQTAELARAELGRAFAVRQWSRVLFFVAREEREPGLLATGATEAEIGEVRWASFWAAAEQREWARARAALAALELPPASPLAVALSSLAATEGAPERSLFAALPLPPCEEGDRLGCDRGQAREAANASRISPPVAPEEVEARVLEAYAALSWARFAISIDGWIEAAAPPVAHAIRLLVAQLAVRNLCERHGSPDPAVLIAESAVALGWPRGLASEIALALRAASAELSGEKPAEAAQTRRFAAVARAAAGYPELRPAVEAVLTRTLFLESGLPPLLGLLERMLAERTSPSLFWKACRVERLVHRDAETLPRWLLGVFEVTLAQPGELRAALLALDPERREQAISTIAQRTPLPLLERALDVLWQGGDQELVPTLCRTLDALVERSRIAQLRRGRSRRAGRIGRDTEAALLAIAEQEGMDPDLVRMMMRSDGRFAALLEDGDDDPFELPPAALAVWERFRERALPCHVHYLELALTNASTDAERVDAVDRHLSASSGIEAHLRAIRTAAEEDLPYADEALGDRLFARFHGDREALARGLLSSEAMGAPAGLRLRLARALLTANATDPRPRSPEAEDALLEARLLCAPRPERPRKKKKKKAAKKKKPPSERKPRTKKRTAKEEPGPAPPAPPRQLELLGEEEP
jgi:hypothetical protein